MAKKCTKCNFSNKDEALFCAECGKKLNTTGGGVFTFEKWFLGIAVVVFVAFISFNLFNVYERNQRLETEKIEKEKALIVMTTTDINEVKIEELTSILKRTKNTFKTTQEFKVAQNKALNEILDKYSVGTATLENYNADTGHIITKLSWHKGIDLLMDENPPKLADGYMKKDIAKSIFSKAKTRFYIVATAVNSKIHIGFINAYVLSSDFNLKKYSLDSNNNLLVSIDSFQVPNLESDVEENWADAKQYCEEFDYAGKTDWRLPTKDELLSLSRHKKDVALESSYDNYWSSSAVEGQENNIWVYNFYYGRFGGKDTDSSNYVRCVRD